MWGQYKKFGIFQIFMGPKQGVPPQKFQFSFSLVTVSPRNNKSQIIKKNVSYSAKTITYQYGYVYNQPKPATL